MNIYTKGGDKGTTSLVHTKNVSKSDDRIQLVGTIDELTSHLGLVKTMLKDEDTIQFLEKSDSAPTCEKPTVIVSSSAAITFTAESPASIDTAKSAVTIFFFIL